MKIKSLYIIFILLIFPFLNSVGEEPPRQDSYPKGVQLGAVLNGSTQKLIPLSEGQIKQLNRVVAIDERGATLNGEKVLSHKELIAGQREVTIVLWSFSGPHKIQQHCIEYTENRHLYRSDANKKEFVGISCDLEYDFSK